MIYKIVVTPDAIENIDNAVNYYKNIALLLELPSYLLMTIEKRLMPSKKQNTFSFSLKILDVNQ